MKPDAAALGFDDHLLGRTSGVTRIGHEATQQVGGAARRESPQ